MEIAFSCDIPLPSSEENVSDVLQKARAVCASAQFLRENSFIGDPEESEKDTARAIFASGSGIPVTATEGVALHLQALITQYDLDIITEAKQLRRYITNRLLEESDKAPRASERLRALELLGKIGDVGLFIERQEVTVRDQTTADLQNALRQKLEKYMGAVVLEPIEVPARGADNAG